MTKPFDPTPMPDAFLTPPASPPSPVPWDPMPLPTAGFGDGSAEDQAERDELARVIGSALGAVNPEPADVDAMASGLLYRMTWMRDDLDRFRRARQLEREHVDARYAREIERVEARLKATTDAVHELARRANFGTKRSRTVAFGKYGLRKKAWTLKVDDDDKVLAWATATDARRKAGEGETLVRETIERDVPHERLKAWYVATGEVPEGCTHTDDTDVPFADPIKG